MTIKAFAEKYDIPYNLAYEASYDVKPTLCREGNKDFDEQEMKNALRSTIRRKVAKNSDQVMKLIKRNAELYNIAHRLGDVAPAVTVF